MQSVVCDIRQCVLLQQHVIVQADSTMSSTNELLSNLQLALSNGDEKGFSILFETCDVDSFGECLSRDPTLFVKICGQGFESVAYFFLENCEEYVDFSAKVEERTALQWACLRGHTDIVERLLAIYQERGLAIEKDAYCQHSEFYSAALGGQVDVMRLLMVNFPDKVKDEDVCQVLLYAACVGGHLPMVMLWLRPNTNVNREIPLVPSLRDSEHWTPFQAACDGGHKEVVRLLMVDFNAEITQHMADTLPEFTKELVNSVYKPLQITDDEQVVKYDLKSVSTHVLHPSWIQPHLTVLTHLDVSSNRLRALPACVPWGMQNLLHLNVARNLLAKLPEPACLEAIECENLEIVNASHNRLKEVCVELFQRPSLVHLDLSHNALHRLSKALLPSADPADVFKLRWSCESLASLNLSHNSLDHLPADDMKTCTTLTTLDVSHNQLSSLPPPWDCKLEHLNVSHNRLERFPPSTEQYWSGSLTHLDLHNNCLDQLTENVLKFGMLQKLNASHNRIQYLAPAHIWDCPSLEDLNLSHNCLGQAQRTNPQTAATVVEFPSNLLSEELRSLDLSENELTHMPVSVCYIKNLAVLDFSNNPIRELPQELGNLGLCWDLRSKGLSLHKADQQEIVKNGKAKDVIEHMRKQLRKVQPCHILKVLVIGPQNKGKSTVIESLVRANANQVKRSQQLVTVMTATLKSPCSMKIKERADKDRPVISLRIWELAGNPELVALQPLLWSENSLFLLVWDMTEEVSGLRLWLSSIRSRLDRVNVLLVATFKDRIPAEEVESRVNQFHKDINTIYGEKETDVGLYPKEDEQRIFPHLCSVVFITRHMVRHDVADLRKAVYRSALSLVKIVRPVEFVVGQLLPQSYLVIEEKLKKLAAQFKETGHPPYLTQQEFDDVLCSDPAADFHMFTDDQLEALKVWIQTGSVLHYEVWADELSHFYFLDPNWLASMAALVLMPGGAVPYKQSLKDVHHRLASAGYPDNLFKPFLQLLKFFDIGTPLNDQESLLLPCLLPKSAPGLELSSTSHGRKLLRFYAMPHVPSRLWSRLILGFLMSMDRFSQSCWQGVEMQKPQLTYWQEGLTIKYGRGSIVIESSVFLASEEKTTHTGILISILTDSSTLGDLAVIGFVTDEIDSALLTIFPHYNDNTSLFGIYALCPVCFHEVEPCTGDIHGRKLHFPLADCAGDLLHSDFAQCSRGNKVALEDLIPDFLMGELPAHFHLRSEDIRLEEKLGGGAAGTVYKGVLSGKAVAVKEFYKNEVTPPILTGERVTTDSGTDTMSSTASRASSSDSGSFMDASQCEYGNFRDVSYEILQRRRDHITGRNLKICRAFSELRQEIMILSQLRHPCLISLLGISIRPSLLVVLELAPFGSLHSVLNDRLEDRPFNKYRDRDRTFTTVLDKDITFKIVYQVGLGLEYLHARRILYRDLKSDNILVCSLTPTDHVNVKISDYGISKFTTSQGMMGMVGTPGYMAPEIMDGQAYDDKVDIFSFSMVIYELLTGHPPFEKYGRLHQLHQLINYEKSRPSLMEYNVVTNFPYLERLMEAMWAHNPCDRPSASDVVRQMKDVGFVLQHSHLAKFSDGPERGRSGSNASSSVEGEPFCNITCVWALDETSRASTAMGRNICWVWESPSTNIADRRLCIYNLATGKPQLPSCKESPGGPATCMAQIGQHRWVGSMGDSEGRSHGPRVDIFPIRCADSAKGKCKLDNLEADPVAIVQDKNNPNKEELGAGIEGLVYIALSNGTIQIYLHHSKRSESPKSRNVPLTEWQRHKKLTVTASCSIQTMCLVPAQNELVLGCGHSIVIVSTDTLLLEKRICPLKYLPPSMRDKVSAIQGMVRNEHTLWCSFQNSPLIMEFEMCSWTVARAYCIEADLEVYITEVKLQSSKPRSVPECQACLGMSPPSHVSGHFPSTGGRGGGWRDKSRRSSDLASPPPRPPSSTKPGFAAAHSAVVREDRTPEPNEAGSLKEEGGDEVQMRRRPGTSSRSRGGLQIPSGPHERIVSEADMPEQKKKRASTNRKISFYGEEVFLGSVEELPVLPPRRPMSENPVTETAGMCNLSLAKIKSQTLPNLSASFPPPSPHSPECSQRRSLPSEHDGVYVQSILCVRDTLWIGSSCGEILVIAVQETSPQTNNASGQSGPPASPNRPRMSLSLEAKQVCNLVSVIMSAEDRGSGEQKVKSGGVHTLVQARDLVVAVRDISDSKEAEGCAEVAVWEACSAERISSIRQYWQALASHEGSRV